MPTHTGSSSGGSSSRRGQGRARAPVASCQQASQPANRPIGKRRSAARAAVSQSRSSSMDSSSAGAAGGMPPSSAGEEGPQQTYTAWDGTVFDDVRAFMKYEMETRYTFKGETGESETRLPGEIEGQPFDLIGALAAGIDCMLRATVVATARLTDRPTDRTMIPNRPGRLRGAAAGLHGPDQGAARAQLQGLRGRLLLAGDRLPLPGLHLHARHPRVLRARHRGPSIRTCMLVVGLVWSSACTASIHKSTRLCLTPCRPPPTHLLTELHFPALLRDAAGDRGGHLPEPGLRALQRPLRAARRELGAGRA